MVGGIDSKNNDIYLMENFSDGKFLPDISLQNLVVLKDFRIYCGESLLGVRGGFWIGPWTRVYPGYTPTGLHN